MNYSTASLTIIFIFTIILFILFEYITSQECIKQGDDCCDKNKCTKGCCEGLTCQNRPKSNGSFYYTNKCLPGQCNPENGTCNNEDEIGCCGGTTCVHHICTKCLHTGNYCSKFNSPKTFCCLGLCKINGDKLSFTCQNE
ncbi:unnamed protein product [Meloidogyne enterolobii]|uniref:Uncharacterized protein n=1 Tax=Meloidogyne enterolobii TaxID=390850 RepID=A0ACB0ZGN3_MELEN